MNHLSDDDLAHPDWEEDNRVHNWKNYVGEQSRSIWSTFTPQQRRAIAEDADEIASREEWD